MDKQNIVSINGRSYDAATGMPLSSDKPKKSEKPKQRGTASVHRPPERSKTLNRRLAKKHSPSTAKRPSTGRTMDIAKGSRFTKFAPSAVTALAKPHEATTPDKPASSHPVAARALKRHAPVHSKPQHVGLSAKQVKDQTVEKAVEDATIPTDKTPGFFRRHSRRLMVLIIIVAVLAAGAYLTVANLPVLSVSFAGSQAGIKAAYPSFTPDGYSLQQPISYSDGKVELRFLSNTGAGGYTVSQSRSSWDSSAVLTNIVEEQAGDDYVVTKDSGLTIYTYQGNAAWVNGGILYVIENSAPLSTDQIRSIATSL